MGDRVLVQCHSPIQEEFGPVVYAHWHGTSTPTVIEKLIKRMRSRKCDVSYATARLVQIFCDGDTSNTGFGVWNADALLTEADSHADAGVVLVNVDDFSLQAVGGYLFVDDEGKLRNRNGC